MIQTQIISKGLNMKKLFMILPLFFLLCFAFGCQKAEEVAEEPEADVEAIKGIIDEITRTWNEGDYEGFIAIIDEEAVFLPPNAPTVSDMETISSIYKNHFDSFDLDLTIITEEIHVFGDLAFSRESWKGSLNPKDSSEPIVFDNKVITIYKKQPDGSWKIWRAMFNSNTPLATE
jgi:ketosteroid isomerase-like protein